MPFLKGVAPIRRTLQYLESSKFILKDRVRILSINYTSIGEHNQGARDFVFWDVPQLQYKNPTVQVVTFKNLTPSPFITCYLDNGEEIILDIDGNTKDEIEQRLKRVICKTESDVSIDAFKHMDPNDHPAHFGRYCSRHCICEVPGQIPCPAVVPVPKSWRGKYRFQKPDELE
uniref:Small ribosomal subunit protein mS25 n=1 Tax=Lynceus sp. MCZ IZ 141354 TaxID=1930659 RepID=A0A9N6ZFT5_9CRUS|nr:EOG090X0FQ5 [Lynceus sp. MCZ IZ 141354]